MRREIPKDIIVCRSCVLVLANGECDHEQCIWADEPIPCPSVTGTEARWPGLHISLSSCDAETCEGSGGMICAILENARSCYACGADIDPYGSGSAEHAAVWLPACVHCGEGVHEMVTQEGRRFWETMYGDSYCCPDHPAHSPSTS